MFDVYVCALMLLMAFWRNGYQKNFIYIIGTLLLWAVCLGLKPERQYRSLPLCLFLIWCFSNLFWHAWDVSLLRGMASYYLNICILAESLFFIIASVMLVKLIVEYARRHEYYYPVLIWCFLPWARRIWRHWSMTQLLAIPLACVIYLCLNKKWKLATLLSLIGANIAAWTWEWAKFKFYVRPLVWKQLWGEFVQHPFIGQGYWRGIDFGKCDLIYVKGDLYGPAFRHNDYLNAGVYIGVLGIVFILWFVIENIWKMRHHPACIFFLIICIIPFFQMTMFELYKASMIVFIGATAIKASYRGIERMPNRKLKGEKIL